MHIMSTWEEWMFTALCTPWVAVCRHCLLVKRTVAVTSQGAIARHAHANNQRLFKHKTKINVFPIRPFSPLSVNQCHRLCVWAWLIYTLIAVHVEFTFLMAFSPHITYFVSITLHVRRTLWILYNAKGLSRRKLSEFFSGCRRFWEFFRMIQQLNTKIIMGRRSPHTSACFHLLRQRQLKQFFTKLCDSSLHFRPFYCVFLFTFVCFLNNGHENSMELQSISITLRFLCSLHADPPPARNIAICRAITMSERLKSRFARFGLSVRRHRFSSVLFCSVRFLFQ